MGAGDDFPRIRFDPTRPASAARALAGFLLGTVLWVAAF